jgi:hypothetical protein
VAVGSGLILTGPLIVREIVDWPRTAPRAAIGTLAVRVPDRGHRHAADQHGRGLDGDCHAWHTTNGIRISLARHVLASATPSTASTRRVS